MNFREQTLDQVAEILNDSGMLVTNKELRLARDNDLFKYIGCQDGSARYLIGFVDDCEDEGYFVSIVFVSIARDKLTADYAGAPCFESTDLDAIKEYIEKRCN